MSPVVYFSNVSVDFKVAQCRLSNLRVTGPTGQNRGLGLQSALLKSVVNLSVL